MSRALICLICFLYTVDREEILMSLSKSNSLGESVFVERSLRSLARLSVSDHETDLFSGDLDLL